MKIGIITPSPVPFQSGGAERLWTNLRRYFNEDTSHVAEVIKLPVSEATFWSTIKGYREFAALNVSGFDMVITGKYPAWMISHTNHVVYMLHPCRGMYEFYQAPLDLTDKALADREIERLWTKLIAASQPNVAPDPAFATDLIATIAKWENQPEKVALIEWPGAFARAVIRYLDVVALAPGRIKRYAAISHTVADREAYFPDGVNVAVAYPPSALAIDDLTKPFQSAEQLKRPYFFTSSRLDLNKRMHDVISAFKGVQGDVALRIAGDGSEREALIALAAPDKRISLLGRITDADLSAQYAGALAVPFVPYAEDYGLIAVEAMAAGAPVITFADSGGVAEINIDGLTGLTVEPTTEALASAMQRFVDGNVHPERSITDFRHAAKLRAAQANWPTVVTTLTSDISPTHRPHLPKLVVALPWSFSPANAGGQVRVYNLYKNLATWFNVVIVCLVSPDQKAADTEVAPGLREICIPKSAAHHKRDQAAEKQAGKPVYDITAALYIEDTPNYIETLRAECLGAHAVVACHPYFAQVLIDLFDGPLWYEAQDVEIDVKSQILEEDFPLRGEFLAFTKRMEELACSKAEKIWVCAKADAERLLTLYPSAKGKCTVVPNCTDVESFRFLTPTQRKAQRRKLIPQENRLLALFLGSGHDPNIEAVRDIFKTAAASPKVIFAIIGSVCYAFDPMQKPNNVWFLGQLSETERRVIMEIADVALNPMSRGSGTSLKMLDYLASGMPVISTHTGSRGIGLEDNVTYFNCENVMLAEFIHTFNPQENIVTEVVIAARKMIERDFSWSHQTLLLALAIEKSQLH